MSDVVRPRPGELVVDDIGGVWIAVEDPHDRGEPDADEPSSDVLLLPAPWEWRILVAAELGAFRRDALGRAVISRPAIDRAFTRRGMADRHLVALKRLTRQ